MSPPPANRSDPEIHSATLLNRRWLTDKVCEVELSRPANFHFAAGQRIRILHEALQRDYSLITAPNDPTLALCLKEVEGGAYSPVLASTELGASLTFTGPHGYFIYRPSNNPAVFVATGTGIAPFLSIIRAGVTDFTLLHGVRTAKSLYYEDIFRRAARYYIPCLSAAPQEAGSHENVFHGKVGHYLAQHLPQGIYDFYLSGRQEMVRDVTLLVDERFSGSLIYSEIFY